jgi:hypothetical protein
MLLSANFTDVESYNQARSFALQALLFLDATFVLAIQQVIDARISFVGVTCDFSNSNIAPSGVWRFRIDATFHFPNYSRYRKEHGI